MKAIRNLVDGLTYVNRFVSHSNFPGWLPLHQERLCGILDELELANDGEYPIFVRYNRRCREFTVFRKDGEIVKVNSR